MGGVILCTTLVENRLPLPLPLRRSRRGLADLQGEGLSATLFHSQDYMFRCVG